MSDDEPQTATASNHGWPSARVRWAVWGVYVLSWSIALEAPKPAAARTPELAEAVFTFSKVVHVSAYAVLAILTGWLQLRGPWKAAAVVFLLGHGIATEVLQALLPFGRTGAVADVFLDWFGIGLGIAISWRWWRPAAATEQ